MTIPKYAATITITYKGLPVKARVWLDRWEENFWAEANGRVIPPVAWNRYVGPLSMQDYFRIIYNGPLIQDLITDNNPFLQLLPKAGSTLSECYPIPLITGL